MSPLLLLLFIVSYFTVLIGISFLTSRKPADDSSALTALTTSFCIDFLGFDKRPAPSGSGTKPGAPEARKRRIRHLVHLLFSVLILGTVIAFNALNNEAVVSAIFKVATYGPLLGLYSFGLLLHTRKVRDRLVPFICLISPICCLFECVFANMAGRLYF